MNAPKFLRELASCVEYDTDTDEQAEQNEKVFTELRVGSAQVVKIATGKHPSDWTRDGLMKHLGIAKEESKDET